jgi:hypothetical protein
VRGDRPILIAQPRIGIRFQQKADNFPHRDPSLRHRITLFARAADIRQHGAGLGGARKRVTLRSPVRCSACHKS